MREISLDDIKRYVHHAVMHPMENLNEVANMYFEDGSPSFIVKNAEVPELINLPLTKRALLVNIVREKSNYDISPIAEHKINIIRETGEALEPVYRPEISVVKEIEIDEPQLK